MNLEELTIQIIAFLSGINPWINVALLVLGSLVVIAQMAVAITPTKEDDAVLAKWMNNIYIGAVLRALIRFAPIVPKNKLP